mmetsp:Transcript_34303/g.90665  ORF Transcript_34303/g.90665 Transcript_34303/m.90665 type:complete len:407 (+) Transcript_34303:82-1302(+)
MRVTSWWRERVTKEKTKTKKATTAFLVGAVGHRSHMEANPLPISMTRAPARPDSTHDELPNAAHTRNVAANARLGPRGGRVGPGGVSSSAAKSQEAFRQRTANQTRRSNERSLNRTMLRATDEIRDGLHEEMERGLSQMRDLLATIKQEREQQEEAARLQAAATARVVAMTTLHPPSVKSYLSYMNGVEGDGDSGYHEEGEEEGIASTHVGLTPTERGAQEGDDDEEEEEEDMPPYTSGDEAGSAYGGGEEDGEGEEEEAEEEEEEEQEDVQDEKKGRQEEDEEEEIDELATPMGGRGEPGSHHKTHHYATTMTHTSPTTRRSPHMPQYTRHPPLSVIRYLPQVVRPNGSTQTKRTWQTRQRMMTHLTNSSVGQRPASLPRVARQRMGATKTKRRSLLIIAPVLRE